MHPWTYIKSRNKTLRLAVIAMVIITPLIIWSSTHKIQSSISSDFKCPSDYKTSTEYLDSVAQWLRAELDKNPQINTDEMLRLRDRELEKHGCSPSPWTVDDTNWRY